jgi:hypothetical protein
MSDRPPAAPLRILYGCITRPSGRSPDAPPGATEAASATAEPLQAESALGATPEGLTRTHCNSSQVAEAIERQERTRGKSKQRAGGFESGAENRTP